MARFSDIYGQDQIREQLQRALASGKVSHAYMIEGEHFSGKEFIANIFSMALQCETLAARLPSEAEWSHLEPCQECHSCKQALSRNHPDICWVSHEKPNVIGVDDIRAVNQDVLVRPYQGRRKVYIISEGEKMTAQAQNALLKTLEEPPEYAVILILTSNASLLLPTIASRCVILRMKPVEDGKIRAFLTDELGVSEHDAKICAAFARGNLGRAKMLANSEEFGKVKSEAVNLAKNIQTMELTDIIQAIKTISEYKLDVNDYLDILSVWYRDVLLFKATNDTNHLIFKEEIKYIKRAADRSSYEGVQTILDALEKAKERLNANVNFDLTMELLLLTIQEN